MKVASLARPSLAIATDGAPLPPGVARSVVLALVRKVLGAPAVAEIDFAEPARDADVQLAVGQSLRLDADGAALFIGTVAATEWVHSGDGTSVLRVRAYDPLEALRQRSRIRRLEATSAAKLATELAVDIGLSSRIDASCANVPVALQNGTSDLEFLTEIAARDGLYPIVDDDVLTLCSLDGHGDEIGLRLGQNLHEVRLTISAERSAQSVDVEAWNRSNLEAQRASVGRAAESGARAHVITDRAVGNAAESRALGEAALARGEAFERSASGACRGDAALKPGRPIRIEGVAPSAAGRYVLTSALHRFDASGYRVEFDTRPPASHACTGGPVVTVGRVVSTDDPEKRGRCLVSLPGFGAIEAGWLPVVVAGAGRRKGAAILPEAGEDVLAIFATGDLAFGFVLGGLYGDRSLPPGLRSASDRPFVLRTGAGQSLELSGTGSLVRLSTRGGSLLEFKHDSARLAAASDLVIEAPGKRLVIRAASVDFEKG